MKKEKNEVIFESGVILSKGRTFRISVKAGEKGLVAEVKD